MSGGIPGTGLPERPTDDRPDPGAREEVLLSQRPHWASPLVRGWLFLVAACVFFAKELARDLDDHSGSIDPRTYWVLGAIVGGLLVLQLIVGWVRWRTTAFLIDETQVRIDHRFIRHDSDRIPLGKIQSVDVVQPFAARILGLAQLVIDVGAHEHKTIEYLSRADAYRFRDILARQGQGRPTGDPGEPVDDGPDRAPAGATPAQPSAWHDRRRDEHVLVTVPGRRVVTSTLCSTGFLLTVLVAGGGLWWSFWRRSGAVGMVAVLGAVTAVIGYLWHSLTSNWRFTLLRSGGGLKAVHGMTTLTTRTVPVHRVQGIVIRQPLLWRPLGWYRMQLTVLGAGAGDDEGSATMLLPVGVRQDVDIALDAVWPGFRLDDVDWQPIPRRSRWFHWFTQQVIGWGRTEAVIATRDGLLTRSVNVVPHARVQSTGLRQGPLQRLLRVADVVAHVPTGPVTLVCSDLDETVARRLVLDELDRSSRVAP